MKATIHFKGNEVFATVMEEPNIEKCRAEYGGSWFPVEYDKQMQAYEESKKPVINVSINHGQIYILMENETKEIFFSQPCEVEDRGDSYEITKLY